MGAYKYRFPNLIKFRVNILNVVKTVLFFSVFIVCSNFFLCNSN